MKNEADDYPKALENSGQRLPEPTDWGFCVYGDAPPAIGGGMPWFHWFPSEQAMLAALRDHAAVMHPPRSDLDPVAMQSQVVAILSDVAGSVDVAAMGRLNEALRGSSQFEWIGSFQQLATGDADFVKNVRAEFREQNDAGGDGPLTADDFEAFAEFTREYGV